MRELRIAGLIAVFALMSVIWHGAGAQGTASRSYENALKFFQERDLASAITELNAALVEDPNLLAAHVLAARVYLYLGEPAAAEDAIAAARRMGADPEITWPLRAEALYGQRKFDELLALTVNTGLSVEPQAIIHLFRGRSYIGKDDFSRAVQEFSKARDLTPRAAEPHVYLTMSALRSGDLFTAEARAIKGVRIAPDSADVWSMMGDVFHTQGKLQEAVDAYSKAIERNELHYDARLSRAGVLLDLGELDDATADLAKLRDRQPLDPRPVYIESVLLAKTNKPAEARESLSRAAALLAEIGSDAIDRNLQLVLLAGLAHYELGELEQAQGFLTRYVERYPLQPGPRKLLGTVMLRNGRASEAIAMMEPALAKAPNDHKLLGLLGAAYMQNDRHDIATGYLEKALKLYPGSSEVRAQLALSRVGAGFEDEGLDELSKLFDDLPAVRGRIGLTLATLELRRGNYQRAGQVARKLLEIDEKNLSAQNFLGASQMGMNDFDAARSTFELAIAQDENYLPARVNLGKLEAAAGNYASAREIFLQALEMRPNSITAMVELAKVEQRRGQSGDSLRWLQKAQGTSPNSVSVALALVELHLGTGDAAEATRIAREIEAREPENIDVLAALARTHQAAGRNDLAVDVFKQMGRIVGFDPGVLFRVARLQIAAGEPGEAMYSLQKALKGDASHLPSRLLLTELQVRNGKLDEASEAARSLLAEHPQLAASHRLAGDVMLMSGNAQAAAVRYQRALELEPESRHALRVYGAKSASGDRQRADEFLQSWVEANPDDVPSIRTLADGHLAAGRTKQAKGFYERIITKNPLDAKALNNLAFILDHEKNPEAISYALRAANAAPNDPLILDTLGWLLVRQGRLEEGLSRLREAHSRDSSNPEIRYHIAAALVMLERTDEARNELQAALQSPVPFMGIRDARKLLEELEQ